MLGARRARPAGPRPRRARLAASPRRPPAREGRSRRRLRHQGAPRPEAKTLDAGSGSSGATRLRSRSRALVPSLPERLQETRRARSSVSRAASSAATACRRRLGWVDVKSLRRADGKDLAAAATFEHPDDDNADDRTVWRVPLPEPVPRGEIALDVVFEAKLPASSLAPATSRLFLVASGSRSSASTSRRDARRAAGAGTATSSTRIGVLRELRRYRWSSPCRSGSWSGRPGEGRSAGRTRTGRRPVFEQADVIDFAWTASPPLPRREVDLLRAEGRDPEEYVETAALLGRSLDDVRLSDVEVTVLLQRSARRRRAAREGGEGGDQVVWPPRMTADTLPDL